MVDFIGCTSRELQSIIDNIKLIEKEEKVNDDK